MLFLQLRACAVKPALLVVTSRDLILSLSLSELLRPASKVKVVHERQRDLRV